jgi:hypothetical protein
MMIKHCRRGLASALSLVVLAGAGCDLTHSPAEGSEQIESRGPSEEGDAVLSFLRETRGRRENAEDFANLRAIWADIPVHSEDEFLALGPREALLWSSVASRLAQYKGNGYSTLDDFAPPPRDVLSAALQHQAPEVRAEAMLGVSLWGQGGAAEIVASALSGNSPMLTSLAAGVISIMCDNDVPELLNSLLSVADDEERAARIRGHIRDHETLRSVRCTHKFPHEAG